MYGNDYTYRLKNKEGYVKMYVEYARKMREKRNNLYKFMESDKFIYEMQKKYDRGYKYLFSVKKYFIEFLRYVSVKPCPHVQSKNKYIQYTLSTSKKLRKRCIFMFNKEENEKIWRERVASYRASNQTQKEWCEQNNYRQTTIKYWIERINKEKRENERLNIKKLFTNN